MTDARPSMYVHLDRAMERYAQGDTAAFSLLHEGLAPRLRAFLLRLCGNPALASDLAQETFLRMHRARGSFAEGAAVVPWSLAIARNAYLDALRRSTHAAASVPVAADEDPDDASNEAASLEPDGEQLVIAREAAQLVRQTLAALPVAQREAFVLLRFEALSVAEAAEVLGATETAVKLRAFRAYEALRAVLRRREEEAR
ncbi:MAG: RNA polymerase sigma factor [Myxococcales bacterium]|nr:RNA polymerase sigma factor [Myxococcales bacterium]